MKFAIYERINYINSYLPFIFHSDTYMKGSNSVPVHWHEQTETLFITSGVIKVQLESDIYYVSEGDVISVASDEIHGIYAETPSATGYCLITDKAFYEKYNIPAEKIQLKKLVNDKKLVEKAAVINKLLNEKPLCYEADVISEILAFFSTMYREHQTDNHVSQMKGSESVKAAINYIKKNITENISVEDISKHVGYSKYHLCHCFKQIIGSTVVTYINTLKMDYAANRLENEDISIGQLALECGYNDVCYFTKTFKKYKGVSPSKYGSKNDKK